MPLIYPVAEDTADDADTTFDDFTDDWSETWVVEIDTDHEHEDQGDYVRLGPMGPREAWDFAHTLENKRPHWMVSIMPIFATPTDNIDDVIAQMESDDEDSPEGSDENKV